MPAASPATRRTGFRFTGLGAIVALILTCLPALSAATTSGLDPAVALADDAVRMRAEGIPMVILFSQASCSYCDQARQYLVPMAKGRDGDSRTRALFRQVDLDSSRALAGFDGKPSSHADFARTNSVSFTPTVLVVGADGSVLAEPIVGMRLPDFYGLYILNAIEQATRKLHAP